MLAPAASTSSPCSHAIYNSSIIATEKIGLPSDEIVGEHLTTSARGLTSGLVSFVVSFLGVWIEPAFCEIAGDFEY